MFQREVAERIVAAPGSQGLRPAWRARRLAHRGEDPVRRPPPRLHAAAQGRPRRSSQLVPRREPACRATRRAAGARHRGRLRPAPQDAAPEPEDPRRRRAAPAGRRPASTRTRRAEEIDVAGFVALAQCRWRPCGSASASMRLQIGEQPGDEIARRSGAIARASGARRVRMARSRVEAACRGRR